MTTRSSQIGLRVHELDITNYECNEIDLGRLFADTYKDEVRYEPIEKTFYKFNYKAGVWKQCTQNTIERYIEDFLKVDCVELVKRIKNKNKQLEYEKWIRRQRTNAAINGIIKGVKRQKSVEVFKHQFDLQSRLLGLTNGVLDLKTLEMRKGEKKDMITMQAKVLYNEQTTDSTWSDFLKGVSGQDTELYEYLIRTIAYAMQGNPREHCFFILLGKRTRNGKSTFVNGLTYFFGSYSRTLQPQSLSKNRISKAGSANPDIVKLKGARFVNIAEADEHLTLDVALIKMLTGQDHVNARSLYKDYEEFINQSVFFLHANRLPVIKDATLFTSNRVIVIPFNQYFDDKIADRDLAEKLLGQEALSGLLNLIIYFIEKYRGVPIKDNLPQKVVDATMDYEKEFDPLGWFLKNHLSIRRGKWTNMKEIYNGCLKCLKSDLPILATQKRLTTELKTRGYEITRRNTGNGLLGFLLKDENVLP